MHLLDAKQRVRSIQSSGISDCMSPVYRQKILDVANMLVHQIQTLKANLHEIGLEAFSDETAKMLSLEVRGSSRTTTESDGDDPHKFIEFASIWSETHCAYANMSIYIPPKIWNDEQKRNELEDTLCRQAASTANSNVDLVDLVSVKCDALEAKKGMQGKALLKFLEHTTGLEVSIVGGRFWPGTDSIGASNIVVGVQLGAVKRRCKQSNPPSSHLARRLQAVQQFTSTKPGEIDPVHPKFVNEVFKIMIYVPDQTLTITAYEQDKQDTSVRSPIGEITVKVDDILSECCQSDGLSFQRSYGLVHAVSLKPVFFKSEQAQTKGRQSEIAVKFKFFTHMAKHATSKMAEVLTKEASNPYSTLRGGCIVTGPAFHDQGSSWETVHIYVCSNYFEMQPEREFLERFVFPALACKCQTLKLHFKWIDLSDYGQPGSRDDVVKRIHAIRQSKIRSYDQNGNPADSHLVLCLLGEQRGRLLDAKDVRRVRAAETVPGEFDWVEQGVNQGMSVLELELKAAVFNALDCCDPIVCIRNPAFLDNQELIDNVPKAVRAHFVEPEAINRSKMADLLKAIAAKKPDCILRYQPRFQHFQPRPGDDVSTQVEETKRRGSQPGQNEQENISGADAAHEQDKENGDVNDGRIFLGNLDQLGLQIYERIWDIICKRYSFARSRTRINLYAAEVEAQTELVLGLYKSQYQVSGGTQDEMAKSMHKMTDFLNLDKGDVIYLLGPHGSGKSSMIARFLVQKGLVTLHESFVPDGTNDLGTNDIGASNKLLKRYVQHVINAIHVCRGQRAKFDTGQPASKNRNDLMSARVMGKIRGVLAASILARQANSGQNSDQQATVGLHDPFAKITTVKIGYEEIPDPETDKEHDAILAAAEVPLGVDNTMIMEVMNSIQCLVDRHIPASEISFRTKAPKCLYFFKRSAHTTQRMLAYLVSDHICEISLKKPRHTFQ